MQRGATTGSIYTEKPGTGNVYWIATFTVPKMAGDAKLSSILDLPLGTTYTIEKDKDEIEIPIEFGACVNGLSDYAKAEHVKNIQAELKVDGESVNSVSSSKKVRVTKSGSIIVNKNAYGENSKIEISLECNSLLATYFENDPILYADKKVEIVINVECAENRKVKIKNDKEAPQIYEVMIERISNNKAVDLYTTKKNAYKFVCAGQVIKISAKVSTDAAGVSFDFTGDASICTLDELTQKFEWDDPKSRKEYRRYASLSELKDSYDLPRALELDGMASSYKVYSAIYIIPYKTAQTLHSWNSLRDISKNAFKIDESKLFTQKASPYTLVVKAYNADGVRTKTTSLHVAERWDELYNRDLSEYINYGASK